MQNLFVSAADNPNSSGTTILVDGKMGATRTRSGALKLWWKMEEVSGWSKFPKPTFDTQPPAIEL